MTAALQTYEGACHCGAVRFSLRAAPIRTGCRCNCSICRRRGAVMSTDYFPPQAFLSLTGLDALTRYHFGDRMVNHYFCRRCGIHPFHDAVEKPGHYRINLGCIPTLELSSLTVTLINGQDF